MSKSIFGKFRKRRKLQKEKRDPQIAIMRRNWEEEAERIVALVPWSKLREIKGFSIKEKPEKESENPRVAAVKKRWEKEAERIVALVSWEKLVEIKRNKIRRAMNSALKQWRKK